MGLVEGIFPGQDSHPVSRPITINCDMGESFGLYKMGDDAGVVPKELTAAIIHQVGALEGFLDEEGMALSHIKPHGALYGMASRTESVAHAPGAIEAHLA